MRNKSETVFPSSCWTNFRTKMIRTSLMQGRRISTLSATGGRSSWMRASATDSKSLFQMKLTSVGAPSVRDAAVRERPPPIRCLGILSNFVIVVDDGDLDFPLRFFFAIFLSRLQAIRAARSLSVSNRRNVDDPNENLRRQQRRERSARDRRITFRVDDSDRAIFSLVAAR